LSRAEHRVLFLWVLKDEDTPFGWVRHDPVADARDRGAMAGFTGGGGHDLAEDYTPSGSWSHRVTEGTKTERTSPQRHGR
jgi:hypothetical protein